MDSNKLKALNKKEKKKKNYNNNKKDKNPVLFSDLINIYIHVYLQFYKLYKK